MNKLNQVLDSTKTGLIAINLVDFDQEYGHRRDPIGYGKAIERFDLQLADVLDQLTTDDLLVITADHGNDPTAPGSDHTREYVPFLLHSPALPPQTIEQPQPDFRCVGATIFQGLTGKASPCTGTSLL